MFVININEAKLEYGRWASQMHSPAFARRTAATNARFLLPHLRPGMRLLDAGCGPGSITIGLAEAVVPGEVRGIDASEEAIASARRRAEEAGCANVRFDVADVYDLPFADGTFDAAFLHAVLQHLDEPVRALREARRVLKPGGVIGVGDADHDGTIIFPDDPMLHRSFGVLARLRQQTGGDVHVGKKLRALLTDAGFSRTAGSVVGGADGTDEVTRHVGARQAEYFAAPAFVEYVVACGIATRDELAAISEAWRRWSEAPGAYWARFWCQAVGWV